MWRHRSFACTHLRQQKYGRCYRCVHHTLWWARSSCTCAARQHALGPTLFSFCGTRRLSKVRLSEGRGGMQRAPAIVLEVVVDCVKALSCTTRPRGQPGPVGAFEAPAEDQRHIDGFVDETSTTLPICSTSLILKGIATESARRVKEFAALAARPRLMTWKRC